MRGTDDHRAISVGALATTTRNECTAGNAFHHGEQPSGNHHQAERREGQTQIEEVVKRALHHPAHDHAFDQQHIELVTVAHNMAVINASNMERPHPEAGHNNKVNGGVNREIESARIERRCLMAQIEHRSSGDDVHGGVDKHEGEIDKESPVQHVAELLLADISELSGGPVTAIGLSAACRRLTVTAQIRHLRHQSFLFDRILQVSRLSLLWIPPCTGIYRGYPFTIVQTSHP